MTFLILLVGVLFLALLCGAVFDAYMRDLDRDAN